MRAVVGKLVDRVWYVQAVVNVVTGLWPILHLRSFEAVTGPKTDGWLVKTVGALVAVNGLVMASAGANKRITPEVVGLAIGQSMSLAAVDVVYVSRGRISRVYLLDAVLEVLLVVAWIANWRRRREQAA
jgi:ABC-type cobalamin transport system permease subunit